MKITKRQLQRIVHEKALYAYKVQRYGGPLTEAQLKEIAPIIGAVGRALATGGRGMAKAATSAMKKGGQAAIKHAKNNPEFMDQAFELVKAAADKVPELKGISLGSPGDLEKEMDGEASCAIGDVLQQAAPELEKAIKEEGYRRQLKRITEESTLKITKKQLKRIIQQEKGKLVNEAFLPNLSYAPIPMKSRAHPYIVSEVDRIRMLEQDEAPVADNNTHHWPRVEWTNVEELVDKWAKGEEDAFDKGDPSMTGDDDTSLSDAKKHWSDQVDNAAMDMEAELTKRVRQAALQTMQEFTDKLINGDYA